MIHSVTGRYPQAKRCSPQTMPRSTRSSTKPLSKDASSILLHGKVKSTPSYLTFHHFPRLGVRSSTTSNTNKASSNNPKKRSRPSLDTSPQKASHNKSKKASALESTYPPTDIELNAHDEYLRRECVKIVNCDVDQVMQGVLMQCSEEEMGSVCRRFLDMFTPQYDDDGNLYREIGKDVKHKKEGEEKKQSTNESCKQPTHISFQPTKYPCTLLPMLIIKCYPNLLDRSEIVTGLVRDLSSQSRIDEDGERRTSCVCVVKSDAELVQQGNLIAEVLFQVNAY
jgi:hypothetical protein